MSNMPESLPQNVVEEIINFINCKELDKFAQNNKPLGKLIFDIIEKDCIVVYFPISDASEVNDGFLLSNVPMKNGEKKNIIYINTYQTEEKQVFAAAHELGHLLNVAEYVNSKCNTDVEIELIVNRFAAELLMPRNLFKKEFYSIIKKKFENDSININNIILGIIETMNSFCVPYNSVVIRLVETNILDRNSGVLLVDGNDNISGEDIKSIVNKYISEGSFENLRTSSKRKYINGLKELLLRAEDVDSEYLIKIDRLKKKFGIVDAVNSILKEKINITEE